MPSIGPFEVVDNINWLSSVNENQHYSATSTEQIQDLGLGSKVVLSFEAMAISEIIESRAAFILKSEESSEEVSTSYFIRDYVVKDKWVKMEFLFEPDQDYIEYMKVFFWNGGTNEQVQFRNIKYTAYYSEEYM